MSWQSYVDTNLVGSGKVSRAAILGQQGGVWAASSGYKLELPEQTAVLNAFKDPNSALANGLKLANQKFFVLLANERSVYGKKQADGVVIVKTKQAVLVAEYVTPVVPGEATTVVEGLADYLISVGY